MDYLPLTKFRNSQTPLMSRREFLVSPMTSRSRALAAWSYDLNVIVQPADTQFKLSFHLISPAIYNRTSTLEVVVWYSSTLTELDGTNMEF